MKNYFCKDTSLRIYLLFILLFVSQTTNAIPPDLTFIIKTNDSGYIRPSCIGGGDVLNSAITWIYPIPDNVEKLPVITSKYIPQRNLDYNCDFAKSKKCNNVWQTHGWQYSTFDINNFKPIIDSRWENFPTYLTSNSTKEYSVRLDIPNVFEIGFSLRTAKNGDLYVCEGWNPRNYPCYYLSIGGSDNKQIVLRKYKNGIPDKLLKNDTKLAKFKSDIGLLSEEEWKTFSLSLNSNGVITLKNIFNNATLLNYTDKNALRPINFIVSSKNENSLWKFHKNDFMFTNGTGLLKFGPAIDLYGSELCISFYILMCAQCQIKFFIDVKEEKELIKQIDNNGNAVWMEVKLQKEKVYDNSIQIYIETGYSNNATATNGFWAVDDVRVCIPNELKTTHLDLRMAFKDFEKTHLTCQSLKHPNWRPIHQIIAATTVNEVVCNTSTSSSIKLLWTPTAEDKNFEEYSIVQYDGADICLYDKSHGNFQLSNILRKKSQGYIIEKKNEIIVNNLIPYTFYNITYWNVVDNTTKFFEMSTMPTDLPTKDELPRFINMSTTDTTNEIVWNKPKCNETYGPLIYQVDLKNQNGSGTHHIVDIVTKYKFENLQPFTNYTLEIGTARKIENFGFTTSFIKTIYNFITKPGIASAVENLELYSTDKSSASLRFDLPTQPKGIPKLVQIRWCHPLFLSGCLTEIHNLTKCELWDFKYCVNVNSLGKGNDYQFSVAIKNEDTFSYGIEKSVVGTAAERVPGKPTNISYKMVNCNINSGDCNINITWTHPYNQNATITMFDVILNESSYNFVGDTVKTIHEVVRVKDKNYQNTYYCTVKYITIDVPYKVFVRAVNDVYKGDFEELFINTDNIEDYVDQTPKFIECTNETMTFMLPKRSKRLNSSTLIVIVQDYDLSKNNITDDVVNLEMFGNKYTLCNVYGHTWVAKTVNISTTDSQFIVLGDKSLSYIPQLKKNITNKSLNPDTEYCFTFALINEGKNSETLTVYHSKHLFTQRNSKAEKHESEADQGVNATVIVLPILLLIVLIGCAVWFLRKYFLKRRTLNGEHIYESMPFDDYLPDAISNQTYDRLMHD